MPVNGAAGQLTGTHRIELAISPTQDLAVYLLLYLKFVVHPNHPSTDCMHFPVT